MALHIRNFYRQCYRLKIPKQTQLTTSNSNLARILGNQAYCRNYSVLSFTFPGTNVRISPISSRNYATPTNEENRPEVEPQKKGLIQRFKEMYRNYWYVLIPVHLATSAVWCGGFYYAVQSGVDIVGTLESLGVSERLIDTVRDSKAGYFALTYALYKLATPLRYAVTVGGTTYAIRRLTAIGWIKPVPSRERIKEIIQEKRDNLQDRFQESKQTVKDKKAQVFEEMSRYKTEIRGLKGKEEAK